MGGGELANLECTKVLLETSSSMFRFYTLQKTISRGYRNGIRTQKGILSQVNLGVAKQKHHQIRKCTRNGFLYVLIILQLSKQHKTKTQKRQRYFLIRFIPHKAKQPLLSTELQIERKTRTLKVKAVLKDPKCFFTLTL